ncbi:MAG: acyl-CoA dehydrogenase family protein, partial [Gelidibacter sp.]
LQDLNWTTFSKFSNNLFAFLFEVGKMDLSVGRLYEGHINALLLIDNYGNLKQKERYFKEASDGKLFGVWNTENPKEGLRINVDDISKTYKLKGSKTFCSGALNIDRPIVTAQTENGVQMVVLDLDKEHSLKEDWSQWDPVGMRPSVSCRIDFTAMIIAEDNFLGEANDYYKEPFFSWGAVRFSTVQLGGAQKIANVMLEHLQKIHRSKNPHQQFRIGKIAILMQTAQLWMERAHRIENSIECVIPADQKINFANMMRTLTLDLCEEIILLSEKAVGIQGIMKNHPMERPIRDLRVYLKQAGPDDTLAHIGNYIDKRSIYD